MLLGAAHTITLELDARSSRNYNVTTVYTHELQTSGTVEEA